MNAHLLSQIKALYGLTRLPFAKPQDLDDLYESEPFLLALNRLHYLKERRGCGALIGPAGSGKTTLLRRFFDSLPPAAYACAYLAHGSASVSDLYREICWAYDLKAGVRRSDMARNIKERIVHLSSARKIQPLLAVDEAHLLPPAFLEELRFLLNFDHDGTDELTLILVGQPHLLGTLRLAVNEALAQRIFLKIVLKPLERSHVGEYLEHRLRSAGRTAALFVPEAVEAIARAAQGAPRLVDAVAEHALMIAAERKLHSIDAEIVDLAVAQAFP